MVQTVGRFRGEGRERAAAGGEAAGEVWARGCLWGCQLAGAHALSLDCVVHCGDAGPFMGAVLRRGPAGGLRLEYGAFAAAGNPLSSRSILLLLARSSLGGAQDVSGVEPWSCKARAEASVGR